MENAHTPDRITPIRNGNKNCMFGWKVLSYYSLARIYVSFGAVFAPSKNIHIVALINSRDVITLSLGVEIEVNLKGLVLDGIDPMALGTFDLDYGPEKIGHAAHENKEWSEKDKHKDAYHNAGKSGFQFRH